MDNVVHEYITFRAEILTTVWTSVSPNRTYPLFCIGRLFRKRPRTGMACFRSILVILTARNCVNVFLPSVKATLTPHHRVSRGTDGDNFGPDAGSSRSSTHRYRSPWGRRTPCSGIGDTGNPGSSFPSDTRTGWAARRRAGVWGSPSS